MRGTPADCVVDTNVLVTASGNNQPASPECVGACARALEAVKNEGKLYLDHGGLIVAEYRRNLNAGGQPNRATVF